MLYVQELASFSKLCLSDEKLISLTLQLITLMISN